MHNVVALFGRAAICLALCVVVGCGPRDGLTDVQGTVTFNKTPIANGTIKFEPENGEGPSAEEKIMDGKFQARVAPGVKKVIIYGYKKIGEHHVTGPDSPLIDDLEQVIPAKFNDATTLRETITVGQAPLTYDLSE